MACNSSNTESTSLSVKFAPMPISELLANMMQTQPDSLDSSFVSNDDDSDDSFCETVAAKPSTPVNAKFMTPSLKVSQPRYISTFASEKKIVRNDHNKENFNDIWTSNRTFPNKDSVKQSTQTNQNSDAYDSSEVKNRGALVPPNKNGKPLQNKMYAANIKTPDAVKPPSSITKTKSATPKIKSGIRRFTPGSGRHSNKKTTGTHVTQHKDKVRCELFTQKKDKPQTQTDPQVLVPVPATPVNRKPMPASYVATPSYPQGDIRGNSKILFKTTTIKDKKYMFVKKLGVGGSSEVYKVLELGTSSEYAVKCVNLATDNELAQGYINEVRLLRELQNSDRVIRLHDYVYDRANQYLRMVLEVGETDLSSYLRARGPGGLPPALVLHYWEEMLLAVNYIHEHGVIHADLKPANFLLVNGQLKLIDFGIASAISSDATSVVRTQATGTYSYISPEALMGGAGGYGVSTGDHSAPIKISFRSDVWSLGCILYSMVYGRTPFGHIPSLAKLAAILDPNHRIEYPPVQHLPPSLIAALKWCLTYNVRERPTVRELLAIPYLQPRAAPAPPPPATTAPRPLPPALLHKLDVHAPLTTPEYTLLQEYILETDTLIRTLHTSVLDK